MTDHVSDALLKLWTQLS